MLLYIHDQFNVTLHSLSVASLLSLDPKSVWFHCYYELTKELLSSPAKHFALWTALFPPNHSRCFSDKSICFSTHGFVNTSAECRVM